MSVAGMESTGMLMPVATPISLIASELVNPAAISLAGKRREMAEFTRELEVRIPVMGRAEASSGFSWRRGSFSRPPFAKYHMPAIVKETR